MEARYIPPHRWRDRTPRRYPWLALTAAVVIVALLLLVL
jgi:energy-coupling factor transporter transmembrane protein EcfT